MADRLIIDLGPDGRVSMSSLLEGEDLPNPVGEPFALEWPLDTDALESLRWYLEDYLRAPYGVYEEQGPRVEGSLAGWGKAVFAALFGSGDARDAYVRMRARRSPGIELVFRSASPALLGLPWELLRDPSRPTPLALDLVGVTRGILGAELVGTFAASGERLRVLMVISRPDGADDVGFRMIARPLLECLEAVRGQVELVVLRPPTLAALEQALAKGLAEDRPFQVVHFDGHGLLANRSGPLAGLGGTVTLRAADGEGLLAFEKPNGGADNVPAAKVAQVLKAGMVPLVVLNACQSGAVGKELEAAVATRLLQEGVGSVVAMAYSVYAVAAAEFMAAFYERLFAGDTVIEAVGAGRRRLYQHNERPSPKGQMPLEDWLVPVYYKRRDVRFPYLRAERSTQELSFDEQLRLVRERTGEQQGELEPVGSFVGRDNLFYELERAVRLQRAVLLHGPGGTGKTELAKAFGRWWRDTGGVERPEDVILHSFEPGVASFGLDGVVNAIGLRAWGTDFARLYAAERREAVEELVEQRPLLLIWDNFESVYTMPDPAGVTPALDDLGRGELREFLQSVRAGCGGLILTSRSDEQWLGELRRIEVGGLSATEAIDYAEEILAPFSTAVPRRAKPAFTELQEWLDGHPLSMRLVLPHLAHTEPEVLLEGLRGTGELGALVGDEDGERNTSLGACIRYSFDHLGASTRRLLAAVGLFQGVADADVLVFISAADGVPERFSGVSRETWVEVLDEACGFGLLTALGNGMYRIHPALPTYLAAQWRNEDPDGYEAARAATAWALLRAYAAFADWLSDELEGGQAAAAFALIAWQQRMLGQQLGFALDNGLWSEARAIAGPLNAYLNGRGRYEEARAWVDRARTVIEGPDGLPPSLDEAAGNLWLFLVGSQGGREMRSYQLDRAERTLLAILEMLEVMPRSEEQQHHFAVTYDNLGIIASRRGEFDAAEAWHLKSMVICEDLNDHPGMATCYENLGLVAQGRGQLDEAEEWYLKSLTISEELHHRPGLSICYHQLGIVAQERGRLDVAEEWYLKSLAIEEELGNRPGMADSYHQLSVLAQRRARLDVAEGWCLKSLAIEEELGNRPGMASSYYQLGRIAQRKGQLDVAEEWYLKALAIREELGSRLDLAASYGQLGILAGVREQDSLAMEWTVRCMALFEEVPHPATTPGPEFLALLTSKLGMDTLEVSWEKVTGEALPRAVRDFVQSHQPQG